MKRIKCFMLLCAFVLALTGSAWADTTYPLSLLSKDVLSFDVAKNWAISVDISFDVYKGSFDKSPDIPVTYVWLSHDVSSDIASVALQIFTSSADASQDKSVSYKFTSSDEVGIFTATSHDLADIKYIKALRLSGDAETSADLFVAFPIVLFEKGMSGDVFVSSGDSKGVTKVNIWQHYSDDLGVLELKASNDKKIQLVSADYTEVKSSDIQKISTDKTGKLSYTLVAVSSDKDEAFDIKLSGDGTPTSKDLVMIKMVYSNNTDQVINYGVFYSQDASLDIVSADRVRIHPMAISVDKYPTLTVKIYNASADAISPAITFKRHLMNSGSFVVSFDLGSADAVASGDLKSGKTWSVSFDKPETWKINADSFDLTNKSYDVEGSTYTFKGWFEENVNTSFDFSKIVTKATTLYASYDVVNAVQPVNPTAKSIDVTISADKTTATVGSSITFSITKVSPDLTGATYTWHYNTSTDVAKTKSSDKFVLSSDKVASFDVYVHVASGEVSGDSKKVTVSFTSADSTTPGTSGGDDEGGTGSATNTITIALKSGVTSLPAGTVGTAYTAHNLSEDFTVTVSADNKAYTWNVTGLPAGLSASTAGVITGTPTASADAATVTVRVTLTADTSVSDDATIKITIASASGGGTGGGGTGPTSDDQKGTTSDDQSAISEEEAKKLAEAEGTVASDGTISKDVMDKILTSVKRATEGQLTATDLAGSTAVKTVLTNSLTAGKGKVSFSTIPLTSLSGLANLLSAIATTDYPVTSMTLDFSANTALTTVSLSGVTAKEISFKGNTGVTTFDLTGAKIPTVNLNGAKKLDTLTLASNDTIQDLNIGDTAVGNLNAAGCTNLAQLEAAPTSGTGSLENLDITGCTNLETLSVSNNKLLGIKSPGQLKKRGFTFSAGGQRKPYTSRSFTKTGMNLFTILRALLSNITFELTSAHITVVGGTMTDSGDLTFESAPSSLQYNYTPGFEYASDAVSATGWFVVADDDPSTMSMDVTLSGSADSSTDDEESPTLGSSGGGCDAGFGLGALSAVMLMFALIKKRS